jgi:hypothetical protein
MEVYLIKKRAGLVEQSFMKNQAKLPQIDLLSLQQSMVEKESP